MKVKGNGGTVIVTDCGHQYNTAYAAVEMAGATTDCRVCGNLLLFDLKLAGKVVRARDFHNEVWGPRVPQESTYYVEF